jgi:hypothetical protein
MRSILKWGLVLAALLVAGRAHAQAPPALKVEGALKAKPYTVVKLWPGNVPEGAATVWEWDDEKASGETCGANLFFAAPPGNHRVKLLAIRVKDGKTELFVARAVVVVAGAEPPPQPQPPPAKPPGSTPRTEDEAKAAIGRIRFGNAGCTAAVIYPRRPDGRWDILTAAHCTGRVGAKGRFEVGGFSYAVTVTAWDQAADVCWLVTDAPQEDLPCAVLAKELPPAGTPLWHRSFGVSQPGNKETGRVVNPNFRSGMLSMTLSFSSGDSGGPNFRADTHEIVATTFGYIGGSPCGGSCVRAWQLRPGGMTVPEILEGHRPTGLMPLD